VTYTEQDCIDALKRAYNILGHSPTRREYNELEVSPSAGTIKNILGAWDKAKSLANLDKCDATKQHTKPECINIPDEKWNSFSTKTKRKYKRRAFFAKDKISKGCQECGYNDRSVALDYHHTNPENKEMSVAERIARVHSKKNIREEVEKCRVLCANCHRADSFDKINVS